MYIQDSLPLKQAVNNFSQHMCQKSHRILHVHLLLTIKQMEVFKKLMNLQLLLRRDTYIPLDVLRLGPEISTVQMDFIKDIQTLFKGTN